MPIKIRSLLLLLSIVLVPLLFPPIATLKTGPAPGLSFSISFPQTSSRESIDGRILLLVSTDNSKEPRFQINEDLNTQQVFGVDTEGLKPGQEAVVDSSALGYPLPSLSDLKPGDYWFQVVVHRYATFK